MGVLLEVIKSGHAAARPPCAAREPNRMKLTGERSSVCAATVKRRAPAYCGLICLLGCAATVAVNGAARPLVPDAGEKPLHISNIAVFGDSYEDDGAVLRTSAAAVAAHIPHSTVLPAAPTE